MAKIKTREEVKKMLIKKCFDQGLGKKRFKWLSDYNHQMLVPKATLIVDNHVFRLRYARQFETPFEEDQPKDVKVSMARIQMDEFELETGQQEICLNMFLMLSPGNVANGGKRYWMEDKEKEAEDKLNQFDLIDKAVDYVKGARIEELKAALHVLTGYDTMKMQSSELRLSLRQMSEQEPKMVIDAFEDKRTLVKYQYHTAIIIGYLVINNEGTILRWSGNEKPILSVPLGENMSDEFAEFALSARGKSTYEALVDRLKK